MPTEFTKRSILESISPMQTSEWIFQCIEFTPVNCSQALSSVIPSRNPNETPNKVIFGPLSRRYLIGLRITMSYIYQRYHNILNNATQSVIKKEAQWYHEDSPCCEHLVCVSKKKYLVCLLCVFYFRQLFRLRETHE